jgi:hypothetical protein
MGAWTTAVVQAVTALFLPLVPAKAGTQGHARRPSDSGCPHRASKTRVNALVLRA